VKPLTRYTLDRYVQGWHERAEMTADPDGRYYAKDEADAVIRELQRDLKTLAEASRQRIAELEDEVERLDVGGVHSCHQHCKRTACVQRRRIDELEAELAPLINAGSKSVAPHPQPQASAEDLALVDEGMSFVWSAEHREAWQRIRADYVAQGVVK
jgi:hypothetical protein